MKLEVKQTKMHRFNPNFINILLFLFFFNMNVNAQTKNATPREVKITNSIQGTTLPALTETQRDSIQNPTEGLVIFNKIAKKAQYYNGVAWVFFHTEHYIGEVFGGGIVFFIDATGLHGLIASPADQQSDVNWGYFENQVGAGGRVIGTGPLNTEKIAKASKARDIAGYICYNLVLNGYDDWYLPSKDELNVLYQNLKINHIGNLGDKRYWSSSETDFNNAWLQNFKTGEIIENHVNKPASVRAIRSF